MELKPTQDRCVLALGCNVWGKGKTESQAIRNWKKEAYGLGDKKVTIVLVDAPAIFGIDEVDGTVLRHPDSPPSKKIKDVTING